MDIRQSRLGNGMAVVSLAMPGFATAAVQLMVDAGARHEAAADHGTAHLFEHMVFKGTARRSARAIAEEMEDVGGVLNAWTSREQTAFHARTLARDLPLALDLIADMVTGAVLDPEELAREKAVVLSEIGEAWDQPDDCLFDLLHERAFAGQPLGRPVLGTADSVAGLSCSALRQWRAAHYAGAATVLAAAGAVDHARLVEAADCLFGSLPPARAGAAEPAAWSGGAIGDSRRTEQCHVALAWPAPPLRDPASPAAGLFAMALGGGMSSRLFQELREQRGLAYGVGAFHAPHDDAGLLTIHAATRPADAADAALLAVSIARNLAASLDAPEFERARAQLRAGLVMGLEGCAGMADWLARTTLAWGRPWTAAEALALIDRLDVDAVRSAGAAMLDGRPAIAAVGPRAGGLATRLERRLAA